MPVNMTVANWLKLTNTGVLSIRSSTLKGVDRALEQYQRTKSAAELESLRTALMAWIMAKGQAWKQDPRNRYNAVSDLYAQVMDVPGVKKTAEGVVALSHLKNEERAALDDLFRGKKLVWRDGFSAKLANCKWGVRLNAPAVAKGAYTLAKGSSSSASSAPGSGASGAAGKVIDALIPGEIRAEVLMEVGKIIPDFMKELTAAITPFMGALTALGGTVWNVKGALQNEYRREEAEEHLLQSLSVQNPEMAIHAMIRIIERERNANVFSASVSFGEFVGKLAGTLADGGTATNVAIGLAAGLAKLGNIVRIIVRDTLEKNAANAVMMKGPTVTAFETCPILGCYYVCCVPTSVLVNQIFDRWWKGGFRGEVEYSVTNQIAPLREQARRLIHEHRFLIRELQHYPGVLAPNKEELEKMAQKVGKTGMVGFGSSA